MERKTAEEQGIAPIFRDRAKERRDGANPDYEAVNNEAVTAIAAQHDPSLAKAEPEEVLSKVSISESKYLGGDMEHTHLVKGLDFALLQKVRMRILTDVSTSIPIIIESGFSENNKFCVTV